MAQTVLLKRSSVAGNVPGSSDLALGEIAVNTADGAIYIKKGNNDIVAVADNDILHIDTTNSRVGIGTTSPNYKLSVHSGTNDWPARFKSSDDKAGIIIADNDSVNYLITQNSTLSIGNQASLSSANLNIKSTGDVGIGTTNPQTGLQVAHDWVSDYGSINISSSQNALGGLGLRANNVYKGGLIYRDGTAGAYWELTAYGNEPFLFKTNNAERMRITNGGDVGIGTTSPTYKLEVHGNTTSSHRVRVINAANGQSSVDLKTSQQETRLIANSGNAFYVFNQSQSTQPFTILSNSNVGIGDTSPDFKLAIRTPAIPSGSTYSWPLDLSRPNTDSRGLTFGVGSSGGPHAIAAHNGDVHIGQTFGLDSNNLPQFYGTLSVVHDGTASIGMVGIGTTNPLSGHKLTVNGKIGGLTYIDSYVQFTGGNAILKANDDVILGYSSSLYVKQSGKVGIGISAPTAALSVVDTSQTTTGQGLAGLRVHRPNATSQYGYVDYDNGGGGINIGSFYSGGGNSVYGTFMFRQHNAAGSQTPMAIGSTGNVGIGTTNPQRSLHIQTNTASYGSMRVYRDSTSQGETSIGFFGSTTTATNAAWVIGEGGWVGGKNFVIGNENGGAGGNVRLKISQAGAVTFNEAFTFPTTDGSTNQVLKTDGSGNLTFATIAGASGGTSISDSDGDTKIQVEESSDEDKIRFDTAGSERMQIDALGRVGIGETSTGSTLHVYNSAGATATFKRDADAYLTIDHGSSGANLKSGGTIGFYASGSSVNSLTISSTLFRVNEIAEFTNNVGIGTNTPNYKLETKDGDIAVVKLEAAAGGNTVNGIRFRVNNSANTAESATLGMVNAETVNSWGGVLTFSTKPANATPNESVTERMRIDASGNVGIGETNPVQKLQVNGNIRADGHYYVGGDIVIDSSKNLTNIGTVTATGPVNIETGAPSLVLKDTTDDDDHTIRFKNSSNGTVMEITSLGDNFNFQTFGSRDIVFSPAETTALTLSGANGTFANNLTVTGNLTVNGTQTILNTATLDVEDLNITVAKGATNSAGANGAGLTVDCGSDTDTTFTYNGTSGQWNMNTELVIQPRHTGGTPPTLILGDLNNQYQSGIASSGHLTMRASGSGNQYWQNDGTYLMMLTSGGDLSIGNSTTAPTNHRVHIKTAVDDSVAQGLVIERSANTDRGYINYQGGGFQFRSTVGDPIVFGETDAEHMRIMPDGNVGIGTTSPLSGVRLDVRGGNIHVGGYGSGADYGIRYSAPDNSSHWYTYADTGGELVFGRSGTVGSEEKVRFDASGNVGIGTSSPYSGTRAQICADDTTPSLNSTAIDDCTLVLSNSDDDYGTVFASDGTGKGYIQQRRTATATYYDLNLQPYGGNVGIGTASPQAKLHVDGTTIFDTATGAQPVYFTRLGNINESLKIHCDDRGAVFESIQDETADTYGNFIFAMDAGVTEPYFDVRKGSADSASIFRVDGGGNVGIGTTAPDFKLDVTNTAGAYTAGDNIIAVFQSATDHQTALKIKNINANTVAGAPRAALDLDTADHEAGSGARLRAQFTLRSNTNSGTGGDTSITVPKDLRFFVNNKGTLNDSSGEQASSSVVAGTEAMRITSAGNVGIGTTAPTSKVHISGTSDGSGSGADAMLHVKQNGAWNGNEPWALYVEGYSYLNGFRINAGDGIRGLYKTTSGGSLGFATSDTAPITFTQSDSSEKMRVHSNGFVGIGNTTPQARLSVEEYGIDTTSTSSSATTQIAIHSFAATDFRSARFTVQVTNSTDSTYHTSELLLVHDGTTANITEFGEIHTGSAVEATFDCDVNSGNVRLLATPASTDTMAFKVVCHSITT